MSPSSDDFTFCVYSWHSSPAYDCLFLSLCWPSNNTCIPCTATDPHWQESWWMEDRPMAVSPNGASNPSSLWDLGASRALLESELFLPPMERFSCDSNHITGGSFLSWLKLSCGVGCFALAAATLPWKGALSSAGDKLLCLAAKSDKQVLLDHFGKCPFSLDVCFVIMRL